MRETQTSGIIWIDGEAYAPNHPKALRHRDPVGGLENSQPEHREVQTLASGPPKQTTSPESLPCFVVSITSYRTRKLDSDNLIAGAKPLRDAIAETLGIDDGSERITWEYHQQETHGSQGTSVIVSKVCDGS